ncbi:MAG TPA: hypothetical protein VGO36_00105 [Solirubrobacterales bacterium]|nr:hypothetical protein [Solirubrobacterales bacterium]
MLPGTPVVPAPGVPGNGRAWELVTPPEFNQAFTTAVSGISTDGDRVVFRGLGPLPGAELPALLATNLALRGPAGWSTTSLSPPLPAETLKIAGGEGGPIAFDPELRNTVWAPSQLSGVEGLFKSELGGPFAALFAGPGSYGGASADLGHVLYLSAEHLLPADASRTEGRSIYDATASGLVLVDVADDGSLLSDCGAESPAISRDGSRAFFVVQPCGGAPTRVYLRAGGTTTWASASRCDLPDCGPARSAALAAITPSGSSAFILSAEKLSDDDADESPDLYRYDSAGGALTLVSAVAPGFEVGASDVSPSPDGSRVFFCASKTTLGEGGSSKLESAFFLADEHGVRALPLSCTGVDWSADSRFALVSTSDPVAAADSDGLPDLYRYDADSGAFSEISVGPGTGNGPFAATLAGAYAGVGQTPTLPSRSASSSGEDIVFGSAERLLPEDRNEVADVYEWAHGAISLVSAGAVGDASAFPLGISPDGSKAFFKTSATLLARDRDGGGDDLYAATVGGGFPEPPQPVVCGKACEPAPAGAAAIVASTPASAKPLKGGIRLRPLDAAARRRVAASGRLALLAEVPRAGRLAASARARVGGRLRTVAAAAADVSRPGPVSLSMPLSAAARRLLAAGALRLELTLKLSSLSAPRRLSLELKGGS